jgi:hypothetical protein
MIKWTGEAAYQDVCLFVLEQLLKDGYDTITWQQSSRPCQICRGLNNKTFDLEKFVNETEYEAAIFSHSHVNCGCTLLVTGPDLPDQIVDFRG